MRNPSLHQVLGEYCKAALAFLHSNLEIGHDLPITMEFVPGIASRPIRPHVLDIQWFMFAYKATLGLKNKNPYQAAVHAIHQDEAITRHLDKLVGTRESRSRIDADSCLAALVARFLEEHRQFDFHQSVFDRVYEGFETYFYQDSVDIRFLFLLDGFTTEMDGIPLAPEIAIVKMGTELRQRILSEVEEFGIAIRPMHVEWALEIRAKAPKVIDDGNGALILDGDSSSQTARKQADEICSALRLFKNGAIGLSFHRMESNTFGGIRPVALAWMGMAHFYRGHYSLSETETLAFMEFWKFFQGVRQGTLNRIGIALRRFNFSYERSRPEDRLIDQLIGFEALLLKEDERQELEYRLALRGAALLGKTPEDRKRIFEELKAAYRKRSDIVHGGEVKGTVSIKGLRTVEFGEFVGSVEELLRLATKEFLTLTTDRTETAVINSLDERILAGL